MKTELKNILINLNQFSNGEFLPIDLDKYTEKIINNASIFIFSENGSMSGFIAFYNNNLTTKTAFLSLLAIDLPFQGRGIGEMLLRFSIDKLRADGFKYYYLEVYKTNMKALNLYSKYGFQICEELTDKFKMLLNLQNSDTE